MRPLEQIPMIGNKAHENAALKAQKERLEEVSIPFVMDLTQSPWPLVELAEISVILNNLRRPITKSERVAGEYPYYGATGIVDYVDGYIFDEKLILVGEDGAKWKAGYKTAFITEGKYWVNNHAHILRPKRKYIIDELLVALLNAQNLEKFVTGMTVPKLTQQKLKAIKIPLPPLSVQKEIVSVLIMWDTAIKKTEALGKAYQIQKGALMKTLLVN